MESVSTERLWRRIAAGRPIDGDSDPEVDAHKVVHSVRDFLSWLLNSHRGESSACPDYGLPDLSGVIANLPKSETSFCTALKECIVKHEPRISGVRVRLKQGNTVGGSVINFSVELVIRSGKGALQRQIEGAVDIDNVFSLD